MTFINKNIVFSRNPIILRKSFPSDIFDKNGGWFTLSIDGVDVFEGRFYPPLKVDISEILDACISFFPEPPENNDSPVIEIEDIGEFHSRICRAEIYYESIETEDEFTVIPGGISRQNYKRLCSLGTNAFETRFLNPASNFFMTTRTAGWRIILKETELYPLYFLCGRFDEIKIVETVNGSSLLFNELGDGVGVCALDIDALRRRFMNEYKVIPSVFDIYASGIFSCRIVIERSDPAKERYRLKFRNSLGVFELIELTGEISISPDYPEAEDASFLRYDSVTGSFYSDRERVERKQSITMDTGVKRPDEVRFLMDMLGSEEVYLLDLSPFPLKVIPSVENMSYKLRTETPENFTLKLTLSDSEINIMPDIVNGNDGRKPRVFTKQFSKTFN